MQKPKKLMTHRRLSVLNPRRKFMTSKNLGCPLTKKSRDNLVYPIPQQNDNFYAQSKKQSSLFHFKKCQFLIDYRDEENKNGET